MSTSLEEIGLQLLLTRVNHNSHKMQPSRREDLDLNGEPRKIDLVLPDGLGEILKPGPGIDGTH